MKLLLIILLGVLAPCAFAAVPLAWSWGSVLGGNGSDLVRGVAMDTNGCAYVVGSFEGSAQFGTTNLVSAGQQDAFAARFFPNGNLAWARRMGGTSFDTAYAVAVDTDGNVYVCGAFMEAASFGATNLTSFGGWDAFLFKLTASGDVMWARQISGASDDFAKALAIAPGGGVYVAGSFIGSASVSGWPLSGDTGQSMFFARFDADGQVVWAKQATGKQAISAQKMVVDASGNPHIAGQFSGSAIFGSQPLTSLGVDDAFLARYSSDGNVTWARSGGGTGFDSADGLAIATDGGVYLCGGFEQNATFGATNVSESATNNFYVAKYSSAGEALWVRAGTNGSGAGVAVASSGAVFAAGYSSGAGGNFSLGGFSINGTNGSTSSFLVELADYGTVRNLIALYGSPSAVASGIAAGTEDSLLVGGNLTGSLSGLDNTLTGYGAGGSLDGFLLRLAPPQFRVRIEPMAGTVRLAWPGVYSNATVEAIENLETNVTWSVIAGTPTATGGEQVLTVPADLSKRFFRLRR